MDHREARNRAGDRRTVRSVATGEERQVSYREAVALVSRGKAEFVQDKPKRTRKAAPKKPEVTAETAESGRPDVTEDPPPLHTSDLPSPTATGDAADSGSNSPSPIF